MKSTHFSRLFGTTTIIAIVLLIQTSLLFVHAQPQTEAAKPPKCCDPMHMPVNGKCQEVTCRNDAQCADKFQAYCTKYNTGQSICRGLSRVCGCNRERSRADKSPTGLNCPADQQCYPATGKCGLKDQKCTNPDHVPVDGQCQEVECRNDMECGKQFQSYCTKFKIGQAICRGLSGICGCNGEMSSIDINSANAPKSCNRNLNGSDKCKTGEVCYPDGHCGPPPKCAFHGDSCDPQKKKCCDAGVYCHQRRFSSSFSCHHNAFVHESCASGIPCEEGSVCINGTCSLGVNDGCDFQGAVCPPGTQCRHVPLMEGTNKKCISD